MTDRQSKAMKMYLEGMTQTEIANELGVSQCTISRDISVIHDLWLESNIRNFDLLQTRKLQELQHLRAKAWADYEASKKPRKSTSTKRTRQKQEDEEDETVEKRVTVTERLGDPRYLRIVLDCLAKEADILGLAKQKIEIETWEDRLIQSIKQGKISFDQLASEVNDEAIAREFFRMAGVSESI